ncbi:E3 ubiquitin-protein ligase TRIM69 [Leuresthes tenuis]|uniref:E3 ubiquitin-protein ligase TRIM69 n=1 Tax=Leuresthes tenuis TaxID=355514 RepID=UPI003B50CCB7
MYKNHTKDTNNNCYKSLLCDHKEKLIQAIKRIKHEVDECREAERETYIDSVEVETRFNELEREIRSEFQNLHRFLDEEEYNDLERLRRVRQKQLKQLKEREKKIVAQARDLESAITVLNSKLAEDDSPKLLKEIQDLIKRQVFVVVVLSKLTFLHFWECILASVYLKDLHCGVSNRLMFYHPSFSPSVLSLCLIRSQVSFVLPAEVDTEVRSGQFVGPIQYRIWKHMKSCLYPNITSITFDPETAHPNLSLSQSRTSVWFDEDKDTSDIQANPRRFHYYYCVLGQQGFTTGRHYWEVEVGSKTAWRVGVAREDVPRGEMATTGTSSGLWTLAMKGGSILACTDPKPTKITVSLRLVRIGVFLDCEKEEVTFYNAITMAPIYTFSMETIMGPLFPFYNPCDTDDGMNTAPLKVFNPSL